MEQKTYSLHIRKKPEIKQRNIESNLPNAHDVNYGVMLFFFDDGAKFKGGSKCMKTTERNHG